MAETIATKIVCDEMGKDKDSTFLVEIITTKIVCDEIDKEKIRPSRLR